MIARPFVPVSAAIALIALIGASRAWSQIAFSLRTDVVVLDVSVRQRGEIVRGLTAQGFDVRDNGVRQNVTSVRFADVPAHVVLALDLSRSVRGATLDDLRAAVHRVIALLAPDDMAAVIGFSSQIVTRAPFTNDRALLEAALVTSLRPGDTSLMDAVYAAMLLGHDRPGRPLVIVLNDGADTGSFLDARQVLEAARRTRAVVYAVTSGNPRPDAFLDDVTRLTGGRHIVPGSNEGLSDALASALVAAKERYLLTYTPENVDVDGWHELSVRVPSLPDAEIEARPGYFVAR